MTADGGVHDDGGGDKQDSGLMLVGGDGQCHRTHDPLTLHWGPLSWRSDASLLASLSLLSG